MALKEKEDCDCTVRAMWFTLLMSPLGGASLQNLAQGPMEVRTASVKKMTQLWDRVQHSLDKETICSQKPRVAARQIFNQKLEKYKSALVLFVYGCPDVFTKTDYGYN